MICLKVLFPIWNQLYSTFEFIIKFFFFNFLRVQLISGDGFGKSKLLLSDEYRAQFPELYSGISELVKSFQLFHRLMLTSKEMFRRADLLMQTFAKQQQFLVLFAEFFL